MRLHWLSLCAVLVLGAPGCVDDDCDPCNCDQFGCWCPGGYSCVDGCCVGQGLPECMNPANNTYKS